MYPYHTYPWQFMPQQQQNMGYSQPAHPAMHPAQYPQHMQPAPMQQMPMYPQMPQQMHSGMQPAFHAPPQMQMNPMMPQMMHPSLDASMGAYPQGAYQPQPMQQMAPPNLAHAPQPLPPVDAYSMPPQIPAQTPLMSSLHDVEQFIEEDEDDFDQERYDAIKARINKLRSALRERV